MASSEAPRPSCRARSRDPAHRYPGASEVARDLDNVLAHRTIEARRVALPRRVLRWVQRNIGAFGGGIEEPYQRTSCGVGAGWANSFETVRIPLAAFEYNGSGLDLDKIIALAFQFGPSHGSAIGRIGIDDIELLVD